MNKELLKERLINVDRALELIKKGKIIIVVDDEDRENEGDFVASAELITAENVNFIIKYGRGILCQAINKNIASRLNLELLEKNNTSLNSTPFTFTLDSNSCHSTGVSAPDRAITIKEIANPKSLPCDFVKPGHIFPLLAKDQGVLEREGHTEATVDLMKLAGLNPTGVLCEIIKDDGEMARMPDILELALKFDLYILKIIDLVAYRKQIEEVKATLPTEFGLFDIEVFRQEGKENILLSKNIKNNMLLRIHSECITSEVFHSLKCDCNGQLNKSFSLIQKEESGAIIYLRQEGRGIGLSNKIKAYALQDQGYDTVESNLKLGFDDDLRDYKDAIEILKAKNINSVRLMSNNPYKAKYLINHGIHVEILPLVYITEQNKEYLRTKKEKSGHIIDIDE